MAVPTGQIAHWKLEETGSASRVDSHGANHLTATSAPASAAGKIGNGCDFEFSSSQSLNRASNADLTSGNIDFTAYAWVKLESKLSDEMAVMCKTEAGTGEWFLDYNNDNDRWRFIVYSAAGFGGSATVLANAYGSPSTGVWAFIVVEHDATANTISIQVDNGTINTTAHSAGVNTVAGSFYIGGDPFSNFFDGIVDEAGFIKGKLDSAQRSWLYNSGAGRSFDDWASFGSTALTSADVSMGLEVEAPSAGLTIVTAQDVPVALSVEEPTFTSHLPLTSADAATALAVEAPTLTANTFGALTSSDVELGTVVEAATLAFISPGATLLTPLDIVLLFDSTEPLVQLVGGGGDVGGPIGSSTSDAVQDPIRTSIPAVSLRKRFR